LDPQLLDRIRLEEGAAGGSPSMRQVSVPSVASDNRDEEEDADLRRLNENLSRPLPIFWNGRAITGAWLARARALHHHPRCQRGSFSRQREQRKRARREPGTVAGSLDFAGARRGVAICLWAACGFVGGRRSRNCWEERQRSQHAAPGFFYRARTPESGWLAGLPNIRTCTP
jgi:hypothetical protein